MTPATHGTPGTPGTIAITDEHVELGAAVRRFLEARCPPEVARAGLDAEREELPPFWADLAALGWLGLHVAEEDGGSGFGLAEAAVVLEELARAGAPGPHLPTVLSSALLTRGGRPELRAAALGGLARGEAVGAVVFPAGGRMTGTGPDGSGAVVLEGTVRPVPGAALADWVVVPAICPDGERFCAVPAAELTITELPSLDPTHRGAEVRAEGVVVPATHQLELSRQEAEAVVAALVAADCAGGAGWCVETAAAHARVREQFGRPIGQFQGVKHRCADMLVVAECVRAAAWDSALAADSGRGEGGDAGEHRPREDGGDLLSSAVAGAVATDGYCRVAKDCIQVLGGIGFTWEHDAHRHLRRAVALRALMGGTAPWRSRAARLALDGTRRRLTLELPPEAEGFRDRARQVAEEVAALPREERRARLVETGYFVPHWPEPWGLGAGPVEQLVIDQELARARVRRANLDIGAWAAPTIVVHGTAAQQERWVGPTLRGEIRWCQLFSEPGAGSDLASLNTRAVRADGGWLISGQKVWTSMAAEADWGICLARTDPAAPKHAGITYFVVDMRSPGIEVRPLREMTGLAMFNEVFLDEVHVPDDCVVGPVNGGWELARTTLANERVAMGSGASFGGGLETVLKLARQQEEAEQEEAGPDPQALRPGPLDPVALDRLGELVAEAHCVSLLGHRSTHRAVSGARPGSEASVRKLLSAEHDQRTQEFGLGLLGADGAAVDGAGAQWSFGFLANRCLTIAGGTSEVQRNVIGERLLGLPRDP